MRFVVECVSHYSGVVPFQTRTCTLMGMRQNSRFMGALQAVCHVIVVFFGGGYIIYYIVKVRPSLVCFRTDRCFVGIVHHRVENFELPF